MSRFAANKAFFKGHQKGGMDDILGDGIDGSQKTGGAQNDGTITENCMINAYKRAKKSGAFIVQNAGLKEFPQDLVRFQEYKIEGEDWWDAVALQRVDLSNNELRLVAEGLSSQRDIAQLNFSHNHLVALPDDLFGLDKLKQIDLSNNQLTGLPAAIGSALVWLRSELSIIRLHLFQSPLDNLLTLKSLISEEIRFQHYQTPSRNWLKYQSWVWTTTI